MSAGYQQSLDQFCQQTLAQHPVYANNQRASHCQALASNLPLTHHLCGDEYFFPLAECFRQHNDQNHWDINTYGEQFASLLDSQQYGVKAEHKDWSLLSQVATFEYQLIALYYQQKTVCRQQPLPHAEQLLPALQHFHSYLDISAADLQHTTFDLIHHLTDDHFSIRVENSAATGNSHD